MNEQPESSARNRAVEQHESNAQCTNDLANLLCTQNLDLHFGLQEATNIAVYKLG